VANCGIPSYLQEQGQTGGIQKRVTKKGHLKQKGVEGSGNNSSPRTKSCSKEGQGGRMSSWTEFPEEQFGLKLL
jgi:hypothetical protein